MTRFTNSFTFYETPSHGYLKVYSGDLEELDLDLNSFSAYSPSQRCGKDKLDWFALLEEDSDASIFLNAYKLRWGEKPVIVKTYVESLEALLLRNNTGD
jgi:hypothetical protein